MNRFKPLILGFAAGAGGLFVALSYHVVHSHDGLQFVPRAPQASLGLAYADIRTWDRDQWADRPALIRALVAHGSSDLIAQSVAESLANSVGSDGGTIDQLRSLLNDSPESFDFDAPLFESPPDIRNGGTDDDLLAIPIPRDARQSRQSSSLARNPSDGWPPPDREIRNIEKWAVDSLFSSGLGGFEDVNAGAGNTHKTFDKSGFSDSTTLNREPSPGSQAEQRRHETTFLEDLFFSDEDDTGGSALESGFGPFDSVKRALDSRASRALERARDGLQDQPDDDVSAVGGAVERYESDGVRAVLPRSPASGSHQIPSASRETSGEQSTRRLWERFDPFIE